ncbi:MAG: RluA family pseudouridine synthase [Deltaproteobacteria bacterium]|nr:RluA family pseudouridine synthase [Deltaproteobacteria bacterium]
MLHQVPKLEKAQRLDLYLIDLYPQTSRSYWKKHLENSILLNQRKAKKGDQVRGGESVNILYEPQIGTGFLKANPHIPIEVIYEDPYLLALNKAPGLHCVPLDYEEDSSLVNGLLARYPEQREVENKLDCGLLQRLDQETSGLILVARHAKIKEAYLKQQEKYQVFKEYLAWVEGVPNQKEGIIKKPLAHDPKDPKKMLVIHDEKETKKLKVQEAISQWQLLKSQGSHSLLRIGIFKGKRHQIRVHLANLGHPILGDSLYGSKKEQRLLLHAEKIRMKHPKSQDKLYLSAPCPTDFRPKAKP